MKRILFILFVLQFAFALCVSAQDRGGVALLGNSVFEGDWQALLTTEKPVHTASVRDFTSFQLSWILNPMVYEHQPEMCVIAGGQEDYLLEIEPEQVADNFFYIVKALKDSSITPVLTSTLYLTNAPEINERIAQGNEALAARCDGEGITYIDLNAWVSDSNGLSPRFTYDGYMLNESGKEVIAEVLSAVIHGEPLPEPEQIEPVETELQPFVPAVLSVDRIERILRESPEEVNIVMLGNSITQGAGDWNEKLGRSDIRNSGQGGYTTGQMLWHIDTTIIAADPQMALIMGGINDMSVGVPPELIVKNIITIVEKLQDKGIIPVIQSTFYTTWMERYDAITEVNKELKAFADEEGILFLDVNSVLAGEKGLREEYTTDGTHLTEEGYRVWSAFLKEQLIDKLDF